MCCPVCATSGWADANDSQAAGAARCRRPMVWAFDARPPAISFAPAGSDRGAAISATTLSTEGPHCLPRALFFLAWHFVPPVCGMWSPVARDPVESWRQDVRGRPWGDDAREALRNSASHHTMLQRGMGPRSPCLRGRCGSCCPLVGTCILAGSPGTSRAPMATSQRARMCACNFSAAYLLLLRSTVTRTHTHARRSCRSQS